MLKQTIIRWLLDYPVPAYDSVVDCILHDRPIKTWDKIRIGTARLLMGE